MSNIDDMLSFDALQVAEELTGHSYKDGKETSGLGLLMHMRMGELKSAVLSEHGDTHYRMSLDSLRELAVRQGWTLIMDRPFIDPGFSGDEERIERQLMWFDPQRGGLVMVDSYWKSTSFNTIRYVFNWAPAMPDGEYNRPGNYDDWTVLTDEQRAALPSKVKPINRYNNSTCKVESVYCVYSGSINGREGLLQELSKLDEQGVFLSASWVAAPQDMSLLTYVDDKIVRGKDEMSYGGKKWKKQCKLRRKLNEKRLTLLPADVQKHIWLIELEPVLRPYFNQPTVNIDTYIQYSRQYITSRESFLLYSLHGRPTVSASLSFSMH